MPRSSLLCSGPPRSSRLPLHLHFHTAPQVYLSRTPSPSSTILMRALHCWYWYWAPGVAPVTTRMATMQLGFGFPPFLLGSSVSLQASECGEFLIYVSAGPSEQPHGLPRTRWALVTCRQVKSSGLNVPPMRLDAPHGTRGLRVGLYVLNSVPESLHSSSESSARRQSSFFVVVMVTSPTRCCHVFPHSAVLLLARRPSAVLFLASHPSAVLLLASHSSHWFSSSLVLLVCVAFHQPCFERVELLQRLSFSLPLKCPFSLSS